jgi:CubicO group peptidase (beta-lactamase class C family)
VRLTSLLVLTVSGFAQPSPHARLDEHIAAALAKSGAPSVSVAVVENNRLVYGKAFGKADLEHNRDATTETRYAIGSISKQFTAAALLLLQEQGKLSLDDKVAKYYPEFTRARETTIRQILSHTAGYEDYAPQDYIIPEWKQDTAARAILDRWAKKPLNFDPGTRWQYSNTGYVLAGAIFEKAARKPLLEFLSERIFKPLGMTSAAACDPRDGAGARAYTRYALGPPRPAAREGAGWYFAAGELCMTASDLAKWNIAFLGRKILSARSHDEMIREVRLNDGRSTRYALGLSVREAHGTPVLSHGGEVSGFLASNLIFPLKGVAVTALSNSDNVNLVSALADQIAGMMLAPPGAGEGELAQVRSTLESLQKGRIDRALFSANANAYFSDVALGDFQSSLAPLGALKTLTRTNESQRGGMTHRFYRAEFDNRTVSLNIYVLPDGRYEQFLVAE